MELMHPTLLRRFLLIPALSLLVVTATWAQSPAGQKTHLEVKVQNATGEKLPGAEIVFMSEEVGVVLKGKTLEGGSLRLRTDANGSFTMPSTTNLFAAVANDYGFVLMQTSDFTNHPFMTVQPWVSLEGVRLNQGKPVSDLSVRYDLHPRFLASDEQYYLLDDVFVIKEDTIMTDAEGKFVFPVVPSGQITIRESPKPLAKKLFFLRGSLEVKPGEKGYASIASDAVSIKGHAILSKGLTNYDSLKSVIWLSPTEYSNKDIEPPPVPVKQDVFGKRAAWWREWLATEKGRRRTEILTRRNALQLLPDGTLVGDMIPPGQYRIRASFDDGKKRTAYIDQTIEIPKSALSNSTKQPYDIGEILVKPMLGHGDEAPDFTAKKLEGGNLKLSELQGKYVLLDFWATWCGPCVEELPNLRAIHDEFGKDARFALVSLSLDAEVQTLRDFVRQNKMPWQQVILGDWEEDLVTKSYGFSSIPQILLIDPAGKIVVVDLRGGQIKAAVAKALGK